MKQYTAPEQTARLIELGFEKPSSIASVGPIYGMGGISVAKAYTIGELIEMLPKQFNGELLEIAAVTLSYAKWFVRYPYGIIVYNNELIDALYAMILILKEEE